MTSRSTGAPPNVIVIAVDTLRADHLGLYGHSRSTSPHLDRLAQDSWVYRRAIAAAPWTTPSFAGIFTGYHPGALGMGAEPLALPAEATTVAQRLSASGYATAGVISHLFLGKKFGFARGFDSWDESSAGGHTKISSRLVTDLAIARLDELAVGDQPFFLFAHYFDPHYDYRGHDEHPFHHGYRGKLVSRGNNFESLRQGARRGLLNDADRQHLRDLYDSEIAFTDDSIGRLLAYLKQLEQYEDSVIVFLADHGEMFGERDEQWIGHTRFLYDELVHVPLLIKPPLGQRRGEVGEVVSLVDVSPTILHLAGVESSARSLLAEARQPSPVFAQTRRWQQLDAIYQDRWKLIYDRATDQATLFDLSNDPGEGRDLSADQPQRLSAMTTALEAWNEQLQASAEQFAKRQTPELTPEEEERLRSLGYIQ